jgi:GAF domain-containing protein
MRRGPKPAKSKEAKRPVGRKSPKDDGAQVRDLEKRLAEALERQAEAVEQLQARDRELAEALEQQTATGEILRTISQSPTDYQPVFDTIVRNAAEVCAAHDAVLALADGEDLIIHAQHGPIGAPIGGRYPMRDTASGLAVREGRPVHVENLAEAAEFPAGRDMARRDGHRTTLCVPLLREGQAMGTIMARRAEVRPFTDAQIALLQTFAAQAVIAIENVRLFTELQEKNRAITLAHAQVTEALEQQTATSEILRVISSSLTDVQPVFDAIVRSAGRLCEAASAALNIAEGDVQRKVAEFGPESFVLKVGETRPITQTSLTGRAILEGRTLHIPDIGDPAIMREYPDFRYPPDAQACLAVPLLREGNPAVGALFVFRSHGGPFSERHEALLKTFAHQAVIAIENVRLFNETKEALEQQTATADILKVISSSPTDVQPVFDAVAESAARLCEAFDAAIFRREGDHLRLVAHHGPIPIQSTLPLVRGTSNGRAVLSGQTVHVADMQRQSAEFPEGTENARLMGHRTVLAVPLIQEEGVAIGTINVRRTEAHLFTDRQVALLQTFAAQAVIAIENVRLFTELQASNHELTTALDTQTATSDILRVISQSQTNVQPVFDTIVASAVRLLRGYSGALTRIAGSRIDLVALTSTDNTGDAAVRSVFPLPLEVVSPYAQAIRECATVNVADTDTDPGLPQPARAAARARGFRSWVVVPMLRRDEAVGTISVTRREPGGFTADEIALLQMFADQAVIAIENVRLFKELEARTHDLTRSVDELTALGEVGRALSSTLNLEDVLQTIAKRATQLTETAGCVIWEYDKPREEFRLRVSHYTDDSDTAILPARGGVTTISKGQGLTAQVMEERHPVQIPDIAVAGAYESPVRKPLIDAGHRALLGVPLLSEDEVVGVLAVTRKTPGEFDPEVIRLLSTFANQSALAIQNARLFHDIEEKSRQLEVASQHKSEFLANMSHELRTPLNAIIGFSEVLTDRMFGELNEKQDEYLKDIYASGTHLLSLINDILDLSKIEAGRMELELADFHLPTALDNALTLVRERAGRRSIALHTSIDERLGEVRADERKIRQVVLNLLSNAIKFTPEGGSIEIRAVPKDGSVEVSVSDTGVGIAPEDQEAVFEEFRQVGTADKKAEGTGLGLTLCRKFIELHGGRIWVKSEVGVGSTFTFMIPVRVGNESQR